MGGNALKYTKTRRYDRDEFERVLPVLLNKLKELFADVVTTKYFSSKESFGDIDFLCLTEGFDGDVKEWLNENFSPKPKQIVNGGGVYSFDYKELQVDLILTPLNNWESSKTYFSYNDLHNFVGKVARSFGLSWGHDGLKYKYNGKKIYLSKDYKEVMPFLGFDLARYDAGFDSLDEIFDFVLDSKYFDSKMFDDENLNHRDRVRDHKRTTYSSFMERLKTHKKPNYYFDKDKSKYLGLIDHYFPGFLLKLKVLEIANKELEIAKELFNGKLVMAKYPELSGKELGDKIKKFKQSKEDFLSYLMSSDEETIWSDFDKLM